MAPNRAISHDSIRSASYGSHSVRKRLIGSTRATSTTHNCKGITNRQLRVSHQNVQASKKKSVDNFDGG